MMWRVVGFAALICALQGCATTQNGTGKDGPARDDTAIRLPVEYYADESFDEVYQGVVPPQKVAVLPVVPGALVGVPTKNIDLNGPIDDQDVLKLSLAAAVDRARSASIPKLESPLTSGMLITPSDTRFARMGSFLFDAVSGEQLGGAGFIDIASQHFLLLTYFDQSCIITGESRYPNGTVWRYNVKIPAAGFHWIEIDTTSSSYVSVLRTVTGKVSPKYVAVIQGQVEL
ncbi:MAG: hypothetical protein AAF465_04215 [Pseudomonadota bacterium]